MPHIYTVVWRAAHTVEAMQELRYSSEAESSNGVQGGSCESPAGKRAYKRCSRRGSCETSAYRIRAGIKCRGPMIIRRGRRGRGSCMFGCTIHSLCPRLDHGLDGRDGTMSRALSSGVRQKEHRRHGRRRGQQLDGPGLLSEESRNPADGGKRQIVCQRLRWRRGSWGVRPKPSGPDRGPRWRDQWRQPLGRRLLGQCPWRHASCAALARQYERWWCLHRCECPDQCPRADSFRGRV
jgi:hypothetical protein